MRPSAATVMPRTLPEVSCSRMRLFISWRSRIRKAMSIWPAPRPAVCPRQQALSRPLSTAVRLTASSPKSARPSTTPSVFIVLRPASGVCVTPTRLDQSTLRLDSVGSRAINLWLAIGMVTALMTSESSSPLPDSSCFGKILQPQSPSTSVKEATWQWSATGTATALTLPASFVHPPGNGS